MSFFATFEFPPDTTASGSAQDQERLDLLAGAISGEVKDDDDEPMGSGSGGVFDPSDLASAMASLRSEAHEAKGGGAGAKSSGAGAKGSAGEEDGGGGGGASARAEAKGGPTPVHFDVPMAKADRAKPEAKEVIRQRNMERAKSNSTSTVFLKSTISVPDVDKILLGVSALLSKMLVPCENFDEDPFVQCLPFRTRQKLALQTNRVEDWCETIFFFMKKAFAIAQWSPESNVIALVLVTRLIGSTDITFNEANWDKVLICAFLLAQKLWDDTPLANVDFPLLCQQIHGMAHAEFDVQAVNQMEKLFLTELHFDIHVDRTCYTQFYFELYALTGDSEERTALIPSISEANAERLEARSTTVQQQLDVARGKWRGTAAGTGKPVAGKKGMASTVALGGTIKSYSSKGGRLILE